MRIDRIVVTGDVLRTADGDPNQLFNVRWLRGELSRVLYELTGLWPDIRYRGNQPDDGRAVVAEWYRMLGHSPSVEAWAATYALTAPPSALVEALHPDYDRALVVGFELSPLLRAVLGRIGVPWVDVEVSPLRFLDDLALNLTFSWPVRIDHPGLLARRQVGDAVRRIRFQHRHHTAAADCNGACVFLAQTRHDRTLIKDGAFFPDSLAMEGVAMALGGRRLVLKPHPLAPDNPLLDALRHHFTADTTDANIYTLLATVREAQFLTISSSAAIEAQHFGHGVERFNAEAPVGPAAFVSVWAHRSAAFWRAALAPLLPVRPDATSEEPMVPDRLRRSLHAWWGFERGLPP
ncbi:MAG TPA: hypothetical protein VFZ16_20460 [Hyphomicrobiaceae bacterium]|nr:hypothetical protein [Hyphomicrobiaceae bacterium]